MRPPHGFLRLFNKKNGLMRLPLMKHRGQNETSGSDPIVSFLLQ